MLCVMQNDMKMQNTTNLEATYIQIWKLPIYMQNTTNLDLHSLRLTQARV